MVLALLVAAAGRPPPRAGVSLVVPQDETCLDGVEARPGRGAEYCLTMGRGGAVAGRTVLLPRPVPRPEREHHSSLGARSGLCLCPPACSTPTPIFHRGMLYPTTEINHI